MKKIWRFGVVFLCFIMFASLLFIAVKQTEKSNHEPKAPISVRFMSLLRSTDPTSIVVELPENHNADKIVIFFGDELGYFEPSIAEFEITENPMICEMPKDLVMPEKATVIWVYTANEYGMSDDGKSISLMYAPDPADLEESGSDAELNNTEKYAVILIAVALLVSLLGYAWLGKKTPDEIKEE